MFNNFNEGTKALVSTPGKSLMQFLVHVAYIQLKKKND